MIGPLMQETTLTDVEREARASAAPVANDDESFRAFYDRSSRPVWAYLSRLTGDRQLADDLLQETFYRFVRAAATYDDETHRRNALFAIATNLARDAMRRGRRKPTVELPPDDVHASPVDVAARAGERADLAKALARLRPEQREMLWLAYAKGSSHAEIAETLGMTAGSIKPLLYRARKKLAQLLTGGTP
jgi:RNA polymerase sigma-70 factor (ECF subfamily)